MTNRAVRILHLESEQHFSETVLTILGDHGSDFDYVRVGTKEACLETLAHDEFDLLLSAGDVESVSLIHAQYPDIPIIAWVTRETKKRLLQTPQLSAWDIITRSQVERLSSSLATAIEYATLKRSHAALQLELTQARDILLKCQKSIAVGRLLGSIAHEINSPLESIANLIYLAQRNISNPDSLKESLHTAEKELQHVGEITKQMLSFHRDSKDTRDVPVTAVLESVLTLFQRQIKQREIEVVRQFRDMGRLLVHPGELRQVLSNLISNAIDAMQTGGRLVLRVRERRGLSSRLCITVADTGSGITREDRRRIGELFFTTKGESGTGLGMWVTRQLITRYHGSLRIYSSRRPGRSGTAVHLCFSEPHARFGPPPGADGVTSPFTRRDDEQKIDLPGKAGYSSPRKTA